MKAITESKGEGEGDEEGGGGGRARMGQALRKDAGAESYVVRHGVGNQHQVGGEKELASRGGMRTRASVGVGRMLVVRSQRQNRMEYVTEQSGRCWGSESAGKARLRVSKCW